VKAHVVVIFFYNSSAGFVLASSCFFDKLLSKRPEKQPSIGEQKTIDINTQQYSAQWVKSRAKSPKKKFFILITKKYLFF
jgi:hypothetical protein